MIDLNLAYNKNKFCKILDRWSRATLNFDFLEKCLGIVSSLHYILWTIFQQKYLSCYILSTDQISLPFLYEILVNVCFAIIFWLGCDVISFEINLIFLIKPLLYMSKKSRQNLNILRTRRALKIHWRLLMILKTSKKVYVFWYVKVYMFCICIEYTVHWDKT